MNLKTQLYKAHIQELKSRITKIEEKVAALNKTKESWKLKLRNKLRESR